MEDSDIIELFFTRSENAVAETKKKYGGFIMSLAMRILKNKPDAEECENDTYMGVWEAIPPNKPGNFMSFIATFPEFMQKIIAAEGLVNYINQK